MTVWADDPDGKVQVEMDADATDIWLAFNKMTSSFQMTHAEGVVFIKEFQEMLNKGKEIATNKAFQDAITGVGHTPNYDANVKEEK